MSENISFEGFVSQVRKVLACFTSSSYMYGYLQLVSVWFNRFNLYFGRHYSTAGGQVWLLHVFVREKTSNPLFL